MLLVLVRVVTQGRPARLCELLTTTALRRCLEHKRGVVRLLDAHDITRFVMWQVMHNRNDCAMLMVGFSMKFYSLRLRACKRFVEKTLNGLTFSKT